MSDPLYQAKQTLDQNPAIQRSLDKAGEVATKVQENINDPIHNPLRTAQRTAQATKNVLNQRMDSKRGPHSLKAQKIVLTKGIFDIFLSLSLIFFPGLLYDGPIPRLISAITPLTQPHWEIDSPSAYALSALIMGAGVAGISAAESTSDDAYKVIATLNGVFAAMALLGCAFAPHQFGSSFLLLAGLQDVFWFYAIVTAGNYDVLNTLGFSFKAIKNEGNRLLEKDKERMHRDTSQNVQSSESEFGASERKQEKMPMRTDENGIDLDNVPGDFNDYKTTTIN